MFTDRMRASPRPANVHRPERRSLLSAPTADEQEQAGGRRDGALVLLLGLAVCLCWLVLVRWYSLLEHRSNTHFAFEKVPGRFESPTLRWTLLLFVALAFLYFAGYLLLRRSSTRSWFTRLGALVLVLGPGIANVFIYPVGALDAFNYLIELKLAFHFDQNPYLITFAGYRDDPFALPAFLVDVPLFYGPAWLLGSWPPTALAGFGDVVQLLLALKVWNWILLALIALAIYRYRGASKQGLLAAHLFLANPLILFEGIANAHNDVLMTLFLIGALLALQHRSPLAWPLLALSVLVKFFTAALAPLFVVAALREKWGVRRIAMAAVLTLAVVGATLAPFWAGGAMLDGLQRGTVISQRMDHASVVSLAQQYAAQVRAADVENPWLSAIVQSYTPDRILSDEEKAPLQRVFTGIFALAALLIVGGVARGRELEGAVLTTLMLFALLMTNLYPWYLIPIFAVLALKPDRLRLSYLFVATGLGLAYYPMYVYAHFDTVWPIFQVHLFLALFVTLPMVAFLTAHVGGSALRTLSARQSGTVRDQCLRRAVAPGSSSDVSFPGGGIRR